MDLSTPLDVLYHQADNNPAQVALIAGREVWSYRRLAIAVDEVASALVARGVRKGDRVALHMGNVAELAIAYYACFRIGAIAAPLNTRLKTAELRPRLQRLRPSLYIGQAHLYAHVVPIETDILAADARYVIGEPCVLGQARSWTNLLDGTTETVALELPRADEPAVLLGTSGTTGLPKFVTHTGSTLAAATEACGLLGLDGTQIVINSVPMAHASGFFMLLASLRCGAITVLIEQFDPDVVLDAIEQYHGNWLLGLPFMIAELIRSQEARPRTVDSLEFCATSGDVCPVRLQRGFLEAFGTPLRSVWGATEVVGALIHGLQGGAVSRIAPGVQVRLVDDNGSPVPHGEVGEMLIRGPNVTTGYWAGPDRIDPATTEGWYHTGDLLRRGEQDDLWFVGRKKDLIIRGGSNIVPLEVERVLAEHPAVVDAAVAGIEDPELGQRVAGFVRLAGCTGDYVLDDILNSAKAQLADYKVPESLHVVDEIPRNALGKIDRNALIRLLTDVARSDGSSLQCATTVTQQKILP
jgi:long-chain acyl-CoA synthetase